MTVTAQSFRGNFPEFTSTALYSDATIAFWLGLGINLLSPARWGNLLDYGLQLFVAHNLSLEYEAQRAARAGNNPGVVNGPVTSGTVDKVSYSRDPGKAMDPKNGHWNLSSYGLRYIQLVKMVGAGPLQVGACGDPGYGPGAWTQPWQTSFPNPSN